MLFSLAFSFSLFLSSTLASPVAVQGFDFKGINTMISFGDSYTMRNINLTDLTYMCRDCTSAGGPNYVVYLEDYTKWVSWDLAFGGAPVNNALVHKYPPVPDLNDQVRELYLGVFAAPSNTIESIVKSAYKTGTRTAHSTLNTFWIGINDIGLTYGWSNTTAIDKEIMAQYESLIDQLINYGETNFLFLNVPAIERSPLWSSTTQQANTIRAHVKAFNDRLSQLVKALKSKHHNATFLEYDAWTLFTNVLDHPAKYNISDITHYCTDWSAPKQHHCKSMQEYFWHDSLHPTFAVHQVLAKDILSFLKKN
ncbi:hypothetical protein G6F46_000149 [Rhizopus delemar]|uniref:Carbohydrate esterase family 16 protein n=2 Tax=Rhizopus TaxID=4842 RepID=A0A9P6ZCT2_9FUNG|nr:hypothetical protein G6F55_008757 [Rhizopus delemar]KAG1553620.1 hypothetical protein G6F51_000465 [Rhizopus arrhizus]KAG1492512.1 hypothetical protein G6F54_009260 [Rhizopus delemar]KAG1518094.1 hypothetical protein G6F53_000846 [Rhizopus delemar]KAG1521343.1 hypothetical protein G6F52_006829 [Rhizopus delemar]